MTEMQVFTLDDSFSWFIDEKRIDPITRARFKRGDRVVVCSNCKQVLLEETWTECDGCVMPGCNGSTVDSVFVKRPARVPGDVDARGRMILTNGAPRRLPPVMPSGVGHIVVKSGRK